MTAIPKRTRYKNRKLLNLAHEVQHCQFRSPVCTGWQEHGCEPIHSDFTEHGKAIGQKADDDQHVAGCHQCHLWFGAKKMPRHVLLDMFNRARSRTFAHYRAFKMLDKVGYGEAEGLIKCV